MNILSFLVDHVLVYVGIILAFYEAIDVLCVLFLHRHLFRSEYLGEPTWKEVFMNLRRNNND